MDQSSVLSVEVFGEELARRVCEKLVRGGDFNYSHRDYCGMGFEVRGSEFKYGEVVDGYFVRPAETFASQLEFVEWLARQSDQTLAREGDGFYARNQTVTRERLERFVK